jgi:hypothetical protein
MDLLNKINYSSIANSHTLQFTTARTNTFQSALSSPVVAWRRLSTADVYLSLSSRTIPVPQLPASNSSGSQGLNCIRPLTNLLTNSFNFTLPNCTAPLSVESYSLGADHIENTASNSTSTVAREPLPINCCCLVCFAAVA